MARPRNDGFGKLSRKKRGNYYELGVWVRDGAGKNVFHRLGREGDPDIQEKYVEFQHKMLQVRKAVPKEGVTLAMLFLKYMELRLPKLHTTDQAHVRKVLGLVLDDFGNMMVDDFDSVEFRKAQELVALEGQRKDAGKKVWSFSHVNKLMKYLVSVLKWGVSRKLFPAANLLEIKTVEPVGRGDEVYELEVNEPRTDVPDEVILASLPHLSPILQDMVRIQRIAGMRPSELCALRVEHVLKATNGVIEMREHKTARFGTRRYFAFTQDELRILRRRCAGKGFDEYVFTPRDAYLEAMEGSAIAPDKLERVLARYAERYDTHAYWRAVKRKLDAARQKGVKIPNWTPYQIRHTFVTETALKYGMEMASSLAGHKSLRTTEIYDHKAQRVAIRAACERAGETPWGHNEKGPEPKP